MDTCNNIKFGGKATYKIKVQGKLNKNWSESLGGMTINTELISEKQFVTTLTGLIQDQAALSGILNTLYEMHLPVISVKCIGTKEDN
jgi:hypothetical protein